MSQVYLNNAFVDGQQAMLPIMDRATLYGDGVYELIPVYKGRMFSELLHLKRLQNSLDLTLMSAPMSTQQWQKTLRTLLEKNNLADQDAMIYLQVTRGAPEKRTHDWSNNIAPNVFAYATPATHPTIKEYAQGASAITHEDTRRLENNVKSIALQTNILIQHKAAQNGAVEALLFRNGYLTEGTLSNIFIVKDKEIATPPADRTILNGVTRRTVLRIAKQENLYATERLVHFDEVMNADEIWITSSSKGIVPIYMLDNKPVGNAEKTGPVWEKMIQCFHEILEACAAGAANE
jgi:D-alanine transaminase